jgi:hypothetical protein
VEVHPEFTLAFVEFDDQGRFWSRDQIDQFERVLQTENARADVSGITVVVFAHGWRHDAGVCDANVACFRTFLTTLHADMLVASRAGGMLPKRIIALYAAWRGLSTKVFPLEQLSFYARNRVAHRIADGDLLELLMRTELFVRKVNAAEPNRARLAVLGHSLGGTMIFSALANVLEERVLAARAHADDPTGRENRIRGFGDLVVLINPAFEASRYAPLNELARSFPAFSPLQTPVIVTIASETDSPNRTWFPAGRWLATLFQHSGERSPRRELVTSIGNYEPFWTHRLTAAAPPAERYGGSPRDIFPVRRRDCGCDLSVEPMSMEEAAYLTSLLRGGRPRAPTDPSAPAPYGRALLSCLKPIDPRHPFWVVRASDEVVHGHNGIFTTYLADFVRRVIIEASAAATTR